jgi:two-component system CheB/CheR fusion protein
MIEKVTPQELQQGQESKKEDEKDTEGEVSLPVEQKDSPRVIVGIGASAGGLEALEMFFTHVPGKSGMAFVVIQHQDPGQTSLLPEILQRYTDMQVVQVSEGVKAQPNTVYIKPPDYDLSIIQSSFTLLRPTAGLGGGGRKCPSIYSSGTSRRTRMEKL